MPIVSIALKLGISTRKIKKMKLLTMIAAAVLTLSISAPVKSEQIPQVPSPIVVLPTHGKSVNLLSDWIARGGTERSKCIVSAMASASAIYYRKHYESETIMYYAGDLRNKICSWDDEAYFVLVEDQMKILSNSARSQQVFFGEQLMEHYRVNGLTVK
jgi:hypothetical protein